MENELSTSRGLVVLRPAHAADAAAFRALRLEALHAHPQAFSADLAVNREHPAAYWSDRLAALGEEGALYFAAHAGTLVGMCGIQRGHSPKTRHSAVIWGVYVQPAWRGSGIGEALIGQCLDWARGHAVSAVKLAVITTNAAAIRCYARCGFQAYGVEPQALRYADVMYDELLMVNVLHDREVQV